MKKFSLALNIILLAGLGYIAMTGKIQWNDNPLTAKDPCNLCKDYNGMPFNDLDVDMLKDMTAKYDTTTSLYDRASKRKIVRGSGGGLVEDSRSIWFSLDSLKKFIWEVETSVCANSCKNEKQNLNLNLGIRLYYARYPIRSQVASYPLQLTGISSVYENLHTIFMVPTYENNNANTDFDPRNFDQNTCTYKTIEKGQKALVFAPIPIAAPGQGTLAKNHGGLCPPLTNCQGSAF